MERFSINILHQQIYRVCRLCGVDHPDKLPIIEDDDVVILLDEDDETSLVQKIEECVGILVHKDDQMPQQICQLCLEKVNDFYEYRSMCAATNVQTRTLLNLHMVQPVVKRVKIELPPAQEEIVPEMPELEEMEDVDDFIETRSTRATKAKARDERTPYNEEFKEFEETLQKKRPKFEHACEYCTDVFTESLGLQEHLKRRHTPRVYRYACYTCYEYFETQRDLKDHEAWHKATRTKYQCFRCHKKFLGSKTYTTHIDTKACVRPERSIVHAQLVPDLRCPECRKLFKTRNLFEWHACFLKAKSNCPKCGKFFRQKQPLQRHYILYCTGTLPVTEPLVDDEVKIEAIESKPDIDFPVEPAVAGGSVVMGDRKRGRGRPSGKKSSHPQQFNDEMKVEKEEQCELPFPPPLEVCMEVKSEEAPSAVPAGRYTEDPPVTSRLRSGIMPYNSDDTASTSAEHTSRKTRRTRSATMEHEERTVTDTNSAPSECTLSASSSAKQPMVTLSMETVKKEMLEMIELRKQLAAGCLPHSDEVDENTQNAGTTEDDHAVDNWQDDGNDNSNDSVDNTVPETTNTNAAGDRTGETVASEPAATPLVDQVHTANDPLEKESEVESESISHPVDIAIKQEPQEEAMRIVQNPLRMTIKKEKGLLNDGEGASGGTTSWTIEPSATDDPLNSVVSTKPSKGSSPSKKASKRKEKRSQPSDNHREERSEPVKSTQDGTVRVKQEVPDPEDVDDEHQNAEDRSAVVRIKSEPIDPGYIGRPIKSEFPSDPGVGPDFDSDSTNHYDGMDTDNGPAIAFDGVHVKSERFADDDTAEDEANNSSFYGFGEEEFRSQKILSNPFSKSVRKNDENTLRRKTQQGKGKSKLSKMINPFALMKQKATEDQRRASLDLPPKSVPVNSEVSSSDPVALDSSPLSTCNLLDQQTHTEGGSASGVEAAHKPQSEITQEFPDLGGATEENEEDSNDSTTGVETEQSNDHNTVKDTVNSVENYVETTQDRHRTEGTDAANPPSQLSAEDASDGYENNMDHMNVDQPVIGECTSKLPTLKKSETLETEQYDVTDVRDDQRYEGSENPEKLNSTQLLRDSTARDEFNGNLTKSSKVTNEILDKELSNYEQSTHADDSTNNEMSVEKENPKIPEVTHESDAKEVERKISAPAEDSPSHTEIDFRNKMAETYAATPEEDAGSSKQDLATTDIPGDVEMNQTLLQSSDSGVMFKTVDSQTGKETVDPITGTCLPQANERSSSDKVKTSAALDTFMDGSEVRRSSPEKDAEVENEVSQELAPVNTESINQHVSSVTESPLTMT